VAASNTYFCFYFAKVTPMLKLVMALFFHNFMKSLQSQVAASCKFNYVSAITCTPWRKTNYRRKLHLIKVFSVYERFHLNLNKSILRFCANKINSAEPIVFTTTPKQCSLLVCIKCDKTKQPQAMQRLLDDGSYDKSLVAKTFPSFSSTNSAQK